MSRRPGDWDCPVCNQLIFGSRPECRKCGSKKPGISTTTITTSTHNVTRRPGDWNCPNCNVVIFGSRSECRKCGSKKPT